MKTIFNIDEAKMNETSSVYTVTEIAQQPTTWRKTCQQIKDAKDEIKAFIKNVTDSKTLILF